MRKIFMTGATGTVGRRLVIALTARGEFVLTLSRRPEEKRSELHESITGDPTVAGKWLERLDECDAVINLAGENIFARRWTKSFMAEIKRSRVESTKLISEKLAKQPKTQDGIPKTFLSTSAVGYYGLGNDLKNESSPPGNDFMAEVCVAWEHAAKPAKQAGVRVVHPRLGIVFDSEGGALPNMLRPFRFFVGGPIGNGKQWISWVHHEDVTNAYLFLLDHSIDGPVNVTSPDPVTNRELSQSIGKALGRPNWLPVPAFALRIVLGKVAEVASSGQKVDPQKLLNAGFEFKYPKLDFALQSLLSR